MKKRSLFLATAVLSMGALLFTGCAKEDITPPVVTLIGNANIDHILQSTYTDQGATATDDEDGDLTASITVDLTILNENQTGTYILTYEAVDAAGNVGSATRTVRVYNEAENLAGSYSVTDISPFPSGGSFNYTETISASSTVNNRILTTEFGGYVNAPVYMDISGTSITIPSQTYTCGIPATSTTFQNAPAASTVGTGTPTVLTVNYKETIGLNDVIAQGTYTKQ